MSWPKIAVRLIDFGTWYMLEHVARRKTAGSAQLAVALNWQEVEDGFRYDLVVLMRYDILFR